MSSKHSPFPLRQLLHWAVIIIFALSFALLCFTILAPWQLGKNAHNQQYNQQLAQAASHQPVSLAQLSGNLTDEQNQYRSVTVIGHFIPTAVTVVRLHLVNGQPVIKVIAPFMGQDKNIYLIYRGYLPADTALIPSVPIGSVTVQARVHRDEGVAPDKTQPMQQNNRIEIYALNSRLASRAWHMHIVAGYLQLISASPAALQTEGLPQQKDGPYLSYGIQWIAFGLFAPLGIAYFIYTQVITLRTVRGTAGSVMNVPRERRRKQEKDELLASLREEQ